MMTEQLSKIGPIFPSNAALLQWINNFAEASLQQSLSNLSDEQLDALRKIYNEFGDLQGNSDLGHTATLLGRAIPGFMKVAKKVTVLNTGAAKKAFVMDNSIAQFRLLHTGLSGKEQNFMKEHAEHLSSAFPNGPEQDLVVSLSDQAIEKCYVLEKRMKDPK